MDAEVIKEYQRWADREYVTALTCKNHPYHRLVPVQAGGGVNLLCPRGDYKQELGLFDYRAIESKVALAQVLWKINNQ